MLFRFYANPEYNDAICNMQYAMSVIKANAVRCDKCMCE